MSEIDKWIEIASSELNGVDLDFINTLENIHVDVCYFNATCSEDSVKEIPGVYPYRRGIRATMYTKRPWTIRQYAGFSTAAETNIFFRTALKNGQQGISVAFDLATHRGYDSDHARVLGDVGKSGVAIDCIDDMKLLFDGIDLSKTSVSMTMNGAVLPVLACFIAAANESGVSSNDLIGTIQNDILKEFIVRNTYIYPPEPSMRIVGDVMQYIDTYMPRFNSISISGYHMQEAGADLVQELSFTLANGKEYIHEALSRGMDIDSFAPRLSFFFAIGKDFFMEIAKLRAARVLWAEIVRGFGSRNERSEMLRMHCQTSGVSLSAKDPYNNIIRTSYEALSGVLGGTQSLHTNSFDEALALPTDFSARLARNTQLILQEEIGITRTVDPLGGSFFVEKLTDDMIEKSRVLLAEIDELGGMTKAIATGMPKRRIEEAAALRQAMSDRGLETIVGVNKYVHDDNSVVDIFQIDNEMVRKSQIDRLQSIRAERDREKWSNSLDELRRRARYGGNLLEASIMAAKARATVGEITTALEDVFGRYEAHTEVVQGVYSNASHGDAEFERAQQAVSQFSDREGRNPRILVVKLGQDGHDRGARVIASAFADLGFDVDVGPLFQTPEEAARDAIDNDVHVVGISSQAAGHLTLVPQLVDALRNAGAEHVVVVCGGVIPVQDHEFLRERGVTAIFGPGTPIPVAALEVLSLIRT